MSGARDAVLAALRAARPPAAPLPESRFEAVGGADPERLRAGLEAAGGRLLSVSGAGWRDALEDALGLAAAGRVHSAIPGLPSRGLPPAPAPADLAGIEWALLPGEYAVAENGGVYAAPSPTDRRAALLTEHLVLFVDAGRVLATLHDLYARVDPGSAPFAWIVAGPSKTADIEQALVMGAHGPRALTLVLGDASLWSAAPRG